MAKTAKKCKWCAKPLPSHRPKFCSNKCKDKWHGMMQGTDSFLVDDRSDEDDGSDVYVDPNCNPDYPTSDDLL